MKYTAFRTLCNKMLYLWLLFYVKLQSDLLNFVVIHIP